VAGEWGFAPDPVSEKRNKKNKHLGREKDILSAMIPEIMQINTKA
jgi:hypothetical protein